MSSLVDENNDTRGGEKRLSWKSTPSPRLRASAGVPARPIKIFLETAGLLKQWSIVILLLKEKKTSGSKIY